MPSYKELYTQEKLRYLELRKTAIQDVDALIDKLEVVNNQNRLAVAQLREMNQQGGDFSNEK